MQKIKIGILGYGKLGKGVVSAIKQNLDMDLVAIFTRRDPEKLKNSDILIENIAKLPEFVDKIDVLVLCGGSATDLPTQSPAALKDFNIVDSFDNHAHIPEHFAKLDAVGKTSGKLGLLSTGWDPGLFSMMRLLFNAVAPQGTDYTFWGKGVSQGHSDAIRRIPGVADAVQYTIPIEAALQKVRSGQNPTLSTRDKHLRECYVVPENGANLDEIRSKIVKMPDYFADYQTIVHFIDAEELQKNHSTLPHGGFVCRSATTSNDNKSFMEFSLKLDSNPEFTASVLVAYARAVYKMYSEGKTGAITVFDIPLSYLSPIDAATQRKKFL